MNDMLNGLFLSAEEAGDDDDEDRRKLWDTIPENYKRRYMILGNPWAEDKPGNSYGPAFMMPYGYNVFFRLGQSIGEVLRGVRSPGEATINALSTFFDYFNPIGGSPNPVVMMMPQILKAPVELAFNVDWTGKPIMPPADPYQPWQRDADRYWGSVSEPAKAVSSFLYEGLDPNRIKPFLMDVSPETIEYIWRAYTGGLGTFATKTVDGFYKFVTEQDIRTKDIPFVGLLSTAQTASWYYDKFNGIRNGVESYIELMDKIDRSDASREQKKAEKDALAKQHPTQDALIMDVRGARKDMQELNKEELFIKSQDIPQAEKDKALWGTDEKPGPERIKLQTMRRVIRKWEKLEKLR